MEDRAEKIKREFEEGWFLISAIDNMFAKMASDDVISKEDAIRYVSDVVAKRCKAYSQVGPEFKSI